MKIKMKFLFGAVALITVGALTGCNSAAENVEDAQSDVTEANEALALANEEYLTDIDNYRLETAAQIAVNDSLILDLKARSKVSGKDSDPYFDNEIADLERQNEEMKTKMDQYKGDGKDNWTIFKEEFGHDMDEIGDALKDLTKKNTN